MVQGSCIPPSSASWCAARNPASANAASASPISGISTTRPFSIRGSLASDLAACGRNLSSAIRRAVSITCSNEARSCSANRG